MMKVRILGNEADRLGFGLAGVPACTLEEADEETLLLVSHDAEVKDTNAMVVRLPVGGSENRPDSFSPADCRPPTADRPEAPCKEASHP